MARPPFDNVFDGLSPDIARRMRATIERREKAGTNVHFINAQGQRDRYSFRDHAQADAFRAKLQRAGLEEVKP
jgi:hypothetical protein